MALYGNLLSWLYDLEYINILFQSSSTLPTPHFSISFKTVYDEFHEYGQGIFRKRLIYCVIEMISFIFGVWFAANKLFAWQHRLKYTSENLQKSEMGPVTSQTSENILMGIILYWYWWRSDELSLNSMAAINFWSTSCVKQTEGRGQHVSLRGHIYEEVRLIIQF
jgi:hypothetical protein